MKLINKIKTTLATIVAAASLATATPAQADFYNGCDLPPEKTVQLHNVVNVAGDEDKNPQVSYTLITKVVPDPGILLVGALGTTNGRLNNPGFGIGYIFDKELGEKASPYLSILPMLQGNIHLDGSGATLVPTLYTTVMLGPVTLDPRVQLALDVSKDGVQPQQLPYGGTVGIGVTKKLRLGIDAASAYNFQTREMQPLNLTGIIRYDLPGNPGQHG